MNKRKNDTKKITTEKSGEALVKNGQSKFVFRLYVSGITPRSLEAIERVRNLCEEHLKGCYTLDVIDIYKHPKEAQEDKIFATPTLVKLLPLPVRKIVGDMTMQEKMLAGLDIQILGASD